MNYNPLDFKIDTFSTGSAWALRESGVRITHIPTGVVAEASEQRSQHMNRDVAWNLLLDRLNTETDVTKQLELF
jgi:peptide chain release factor 2